ncbi:hypothetical protein Syun_026506 [Stephania yunnanensis]|uniref:Pentatricopeptide repeat-containing protein n=1 Tax=Stephania yunnanensis TaxID=152371 RepID=A0AAP0EUE3_9MAGN
MLDLLISHKMLSTAANFLESTNNLRDFMISRLIRAHGEMGQIRVAIQWLDQAKRIELGRCLCCYNAVLEVLVRGFRVRLARVLFDQIVEEGLVKPDVLTYTLMIKGLCKVGLVEDAMKVFDEMTCRPSLVTYNVVVDGLCKKGLMESARERGELEEARKCMGEMVKRNCEPNVVTYNALINGFCLVGRIDEAKRTMEKMRLSGLRENVATHRSLLQGMCIVGRPDDAAKHLKVMMSVGVKPDVKAYGVVFNGYCKIRRPDRAMEILDEMRVRDIVPSVSSLNALITLLCDLRELDKAIVILKETPWGCSPNFLSYNTVICSLCRVGGRTRDVEELVLGLIRRGYLLDTTIYSLMVEGYSKDGDVEMAMGVLRTMIGKRFIIQLQSFSVFVKELCSKGRASEVNEAFEEICGKPNRLKNAMEWILLEVDVRLVSNVLSNRLTFEGAAHRKLVPRLLRAIAASTMHENEKQSRCNEADTIRWIIKASISSTYLSLHIYSRWRFPLYVYRRIMEGIDAIGVLASSECISNLRQESL